MCTSFQWNLSFPQKGNCGLWFSSAGVCNKIRSKKQSCFMVHKKNWHKLLTDFVTNLHNCVVIFYENIRCKFDLIVLLSFFFSCFQGSPFKSFCFHIPIFSKIHFIGPSQQKFKPFRTIMGHIMRISIVLHHVITIKWCQPSDLLKNVPKPYKYNYLLDCRV